MCLCILFNLGFWVFIQNFVCIVKFVFSHIFFLFVLFEFWTFLFCDKIKYEIQFIPNVSFDKSFGVNEPNYSFHSEKSNCWFRKKNQYKTCVRALNSQFSKSIELICWWVFNYQLVEKKKIVFVFVWFEHEFTTEFLIVGASCNISMRSLN